MNIYEFVNNLFLLYPNSYNKDNADLKKQRYIKTLNNPKTNFNKLLDYISNNHKSEFMPTEAQLKEWSQYCRYTENASQWISPTVYNPIYEREYKGDCFPKGTTEEQILKFYKNKSPDTAGWEILEIKEGI